MLLTKLVVAAVAAASVTSSHVAEANQSYSVNATSPVDDIQLVSPYGRELFAKLLANLNLEHVEGHPLSTLEYNEAVDGVEDLIRGRWAFDKAFDSKVKHDIRQLLARMNPGELEQLFDDVTFDLILASFTENDDEANEKVTVAVHASQLSTSSAGGYVLVLGLFVGCVAGVAALVSVVANRPASGIASTVITADIILAEIEDAEKLGKQSTVV